MNWEDLKGKFLVLDGPDGCGKSTQIQVLSEFIGKQGIETFVARDPGGTRIGERIRQILLDSDNGEMSVRCEALLYMASRAQLYRQGIVPALQQAKCVLCDRWFSSTYAYQAVAGGMGADLVLKLAETALQRTWPDLTIIIDVPSDQGLSRVGRTPDRMEGKPLEFHRQVRQAYLDLARWRNDVQVVDGAGSVEQVHQRICEVIIKEYVNS
jgi:dTMP kinase